MFKDLSRNPYNVPAVDGMNASGPPEPNQWQQNEVIYVNPIDQQEDAPRRPRREVRGRYNDRDREGYRSPPYGETSSRSWSRSRSQSRSRSRSRSPHYGAPPSRTIILEGIPINMTQEDVGYPSPYSSISFYPRSTLFSA
jgi:RNA-binding protein 5/10